MTTTALQTVITVILFVHGIGHIQGVQSSLGLLVLNWPSESDLGF